MGDLILGPVVEATLSKVIAVASDQLNLALGLNEDLQNFCSAMKTLRGRLQDADEKSVSRRPGVKDWLQQLRTVADEADDIAEEIAYENMRRQMAVQKSKWKNVRYFFTQSDPRALVFRLKMANKVKNLSKRLVSINQLANDLGLQSELANMGPEPRARAGRETHSFLPSPVFGREEDVSKIVSLLVDPSSQHDLPVIAIVGMPGLGKTTLAKAVLENDKIREHFGDNKMWVCVSENFDVKRILMEMLRSISESRSGDGDVGSKDIVMKEIQKKLGEKNYLLILDDVWNGVRQMWEDLRDCMLGISKNKGSRVLVTTRLESVASLMAVTDEHIHRPLQLNEDECWTIIKHRAFGDNSVPEELEGIGKQIAERCKGVPLVASLIGATLQNKRDKKEWRAIVENHVWDSLERENEIFDIIKFSYDHLPKLAMKQCFAFCYIFPKDFVMEREMLIQLWMAQGFLESFEESCMAAEDIGDKYFNDLLSYSLFQEERRGFVTGSVISCKMHDLIHDFAQSISKSETLIVGEQPGRNISHDVRHLNLIDGQEMVPTLLRDVAKKLQTLFSKHGFSSGVQGDLKRLRVLSLDGASDVKQLPTSFGNSKSLRYLNISGTQIEELPKFITKLYNLQTFRFMSCKSLKMPPRGIGDLIGLRHIYFNDEERMPANLGRLTNLQTLPVFFVGTTKGRKIEELGSLSGLKRRLVIKNLELVKDKSEAEKAKLHEKAVEDLELRWGREDNQDNNEDVLEGLRPHSNLRRLCIDGYGGGNLASWMLKSSQGFLSLNSLVQLEIDSCYMLVRIPGISRFSSLKRLFVSGCHELTSLGDGAVLSSTSLEQLYIYGCSKLESFSVSGLSSLEELTIQGCPRISSIGDSLSSSTCLKRLHLDGCRELKFIPSLDGLAFLKRVTIAHCDGLEGLPSGFSSCSALEVLKIWGCANLVSIPEELKQLPCLVQLYIWDCRKLKSFPGEILGSLASLKRLSLGPFSEELQEFPNLSSTSTSTLAFSLVQLSLKGWGKVSLPHQIQRLTALRDLTITSFNGVEEALLGNLSCLKTLAIEDCSALRCLSSGLSSLEELVIRNCPNLVSFQGELKELRSLTIDNCPKLVGFQEGSLGCCIRLRKLHIGPFSEELQEFPNWSSISTLASLEELNLKECFNGVEEALLGNLYCLKKLAIEDCRGLRCLSGRLSSLEELVIRNCPNLVSFQGELNELRSLTIVGCPQLVGFLEESLGCCTRLKKLHIGCFSEELEEFPSLMSSIHASLEELTLYGWEKLTHLPQIQHLTALKNLRIFHFSGMESLPDWFNNLSSLQQLNIRHCPNLKERCSKGSGPDWHKISHIPYIRIDGETIQSQQS